jgi:hypothetical protein
MKKLLSMRWETLLICAVSIAVAGCAAVPAAIPVVVVSDTPAPSTAGPALPTATPLPDPTEGLEPTPTQPAPSGQRLRLTNAGATDILKLSVWFPDNVKVAFGDLAAGQTSDYLEIPGGVYGYAAYEYELNGEMTVQPVIDWVGESPMEGAAFTYTIRSIVTDEGYDFIELVEVTKDE